MIDGHDISFESPQILMNSIRNTVFVLGFSMFSALAASYWIGKNLYFIRPGTRKSYCFLMHLLLFYIMCLLWTTLKFHLHQWSENSGKCYCLCFIPLHVKTNPCSPVWDEIKISPDINLLSFTALLPSHCSCSKNPQEQPVSYYWYSLRKSKQISHFIFLLAFHTYTSSIFISSLALQTTLKFCARLHMG